MSNYYLIGTIPFDGGRVHVLQNSKGSAQLYETFLDAAEAANELTEMKVMGEMKVIKIKPRTLMT